MKTTCTIAFTLQDSAQKESSKSTCSWNWARPYRRSRKASGIGSSSWTKGDCENGFFAGLILG